MVHELQFILLLPPFLLNIYYCVFSSHSKSIHARLLISEWLSLPALLSRFSPVHLFGTLWTVDCQSPLSAGFSRQKH